MWLANRSGGKTRALSILHHVNSLFKENCWTLHAATIEAQAKLCKMYIDEYFDLEVFEGAEGYPSSTTVVHYAETGAKIDIRPSTMSAMSGPKAQITTLDEIEFMKWENLQQAVGIGHSLPHIPSLLILGSTRQKIFGSMHRLSENAHKMGVARYSWCLWETMQRCPTNSNACPLWERCEGKKCQRGDGYWAVDDVIPKAAMVDEEVWMTQYECSKPSRQGLVYSTFDEAIHVSAVKGEYRAGLPTYLSCDWGYTAPAAVGFYQRTGEFGWKYDEIYVQGLLHQELLNRVLEKKQHWGARFEAGWGDPEDADANAMFRKQLKIPWYAGNNNIEERTMGVRHRLRDARGVATIFFHPRCVATVREMSLYHLREIGVGSDGSPVYDETPVDADDHAMSELGYFCWGTRQGVSSLSMADVITVQPRTPAPDPGQVGPVGNIRGKQF